MEQLQGQLVTARADRRHAKQDANKKSTLISHLQARLREVTPPVTTPMKVGAGSDGSTPSPAGSTGKAASKRLRSDLRRRDGTVRELRAKVSALSESLAGVAAVKEALQGHLSSARRELRSRKAGLDVLRARVTKLEGQAAAADDALRRVTELKSQCSSLKRELAAKDATIRKHSLQVSQLQSATDRVLSSDEALVDKLDVLSAAVTGASNQVMVESVRLTAELAAEAQALEILRSDADALPDAPSLAGALNVSTDDAAALLASLKDGGVGAGAGASASSGPQGLAHRVLAAEAHREEALAAMRDAIARGDGEALRAQLVDAATRFAGLERQLAQLRCRKTSAPAAAGDNLHSHL